MAIDSYGGPDAQDTLLIPGSPLWWLRRLERKLSRRRGEIQVYEDYYVGNQPLAFAGEKFLKAFGGLFEAFADNWCDLVVDAVEERLDVEGFRLDVEKEKGDDDAWRIWQANNLDVDSEIAHTEAMINCESYALVWANPDDAATPLITIEHPQQVIVEMAAGSRRTRRAALKRWTDETGVEMATVYMPDAIYKYRTRTKAEQKARLLTEGPGKWIAREEPGEKWPLPNPLGYVTMFPIANRPRLLVPGVSELKRVVPLQNAVNKLVADMLVASEYAAFKQRWVTGMDIPIDPDTGQEIEPFRSAVDRMFMAEDEKTRFGEFSETQLSNFVAGIEMLVQHIASQTRTPPHYFYLKGQFPSGESIKSAETGLVKKSRRKMRVFGESWEEIIRCAFAVLDDPRAKALGAETIWGDPESRTESEHIDATIKLLALDVPKRALWERAGFTQIQIKRFDEMLAEQEANAVEVDAEPDPTLSVRA